jgi:lysyl-tRNA synthetase class 2
MCSPLLIFVPFNKTSLNTKTPVAETHGPSRGESQLILIVAPLNCSRYLKKWSSLATRQISAKPPTFNFRIFLTSFYKNLAERAYTIIKNQKQVVKFIILFELTGKLKWIRIKKSINNMATIDELRKIRLKKLEAIKKALISPYPERTKRTHKIEEALKDFNQLSRLKKEIVLVGRIRSFREHGGSTFLHIEDGTGKIQAYFRKNRIGESGYKFFLDNFDIGDFIEVRGILFKTKRGEKTIEVADFKMLAKSLLPLPEKWHGLQDIEERFRKRYLDLIFNPEIKKKFELRSEIIKEIREFLEKEGFIPVETPILQPIYGGAKAKPFKTHLNALDMDLYLRISPELYLKRLLVGGFEKVYEIGKCFRNEGVDRSHNPDFTMLEFYWAYADYKDLMKLTEKMFENLLKKIFGRLEISYEGKKINFKTPWPRIEFNQILRKYTKIDLEEINLEALKREAKKMGIEFEESAGKAEIADEIFKKICRPNIQQPTFIINFPLGFQPLAKALEREPSKLANFQLIIAGWELVNAFSELNDPLEQRRRFEEQEKFFKQGFEEAQRMDEDFLEALEYGMPPAAGFGMGIDRLVAILTDSHSLREVILFPTMRPK